jgi:hypothetical protein
MGRGKIPAGDTPVFFNVSGDRGDDVCGSLGLLGIQVALLIGRFASFDLLNNVVN